MKQNEGEVPQYFIQHSHEAIIQPQEWEGPLTEFDNKLWLAVVGTVTVRTDGQLVFRFRNGVEIGT